MMIRVAVENRSGGRNQDRAHYFTSPDSVVLVLADGAGGFGDGARAADRVVTEAQALFSGVHNSPTASLESADVALAREGILSTGVIVEIRRDRVIGASVGDSVAWLVTDGQVQELTAAQRRKPLLGDGAFPVSFRTTELRGRLLLASDGLINYARRDAIISAANGGDLQVSAKLLVDLPRLASGDYPDDVSVILAEPDYG
jgi:serine/threonine protein phosphatase PrpC